MAGKIEAVVFDIGGVLLDWNPRYLYRKLMDDAQDMEDFLTSVCNDEWNASLDRGRNWQEAVDDLSAKFPARAALIAAYRDRWDEMVPGVLEDTLTILHDLRRAGYPIYSITNFNEVTYRRAAARFPFMDEFDGVIISGEVKILKPDAAIYQALLDQYNLRADTLYFTDDRADNVNAARALGFASDVFTSPAQLRADLTRHGVL